MLAALAANSAIAVAKGTAAVLTGSPSLMAETLHTVADTGNEALLWVAVRRSGRPADATHPFGYGAERYFWALLAAIGMFLVGGALSIWEGVTALLHPRELDAFWVGVGVLVVSITLDGVSRAIAVRGLRRQAAQRGIPVRRLLRESADPTIITVYFEDTIDVIGAALALVALVLHRVLGSGVPDALASIVIGLLLAVVALRMASRNRALLGNLAIPERYQEDLRARLLAAPEVEEVARLEAVLLGAGEALVAADVVLDPALDGPGAAAAVERIRAELHRDVPALRRLYVTPVTAPAARVASSGDDLRTFDR